jgi:DNA sulfur modification protein DndB
MSFFYGKLVQNEELAKTARLRARKYHEVTVSKAERDAYLAQRWTVGRELKTRVRLRQYKQSDELLEDEVWLLFWNMGFSEMNEDRNFRTQAGPIQKQSEAD